MTLVCLKTEWQSLWEQAEYRAERFREADKRIMSVYQFGLRYADPLTLPEIRRVLNQARRDLGKPPIQGHLSRWHRPEFNRELGFLVIEKLAPVFLQESKTSNTEEKGQC